MCSVRNFPLQFKQLKCNYVSAEGEVSFIISQDIITYQETTSMKTQTDIKIFIQNSLLSFLI